MIFLFRSVIAKIFSKRYILFIVINCLPFILKKELKFSLYKIYTTIISLVIVILCFILKMSRFSSNIIFQLVLVFSSLLLSFYIYLENKMHDYLDDYGDYLKQESDSINKIDKNSKIKEVKTRNGGKAKI